MDVPNRNFLWNFSTHVLASHFDTIEGWKVIVEHRDIYYAKKLNNFPMCGS